MIVYYRRPEHVCAGACLYIGLSVYVVKKLRHSIHTTHFTRTKNLQVDATPCNAHADLFRALRGGGAGTYGIATSITYRTQPLASNYGAVRVRADSPKTAFQGRSWYSDDFPALHLLLSFPS